jgi:hypothetical protein
MAESSSSPGTEEEKPECNGSRSSQQSSSSFASSATFSSTLSRHHYPHGEGPIRSVTQLSGPETRRQYPILQRVETTLSTIRSRKPVGPFRHPLAQVPTTKDVIVDFDGPDDPYRPLNWTFKKKVVTTLLYGLTTMGSTWASSVISPGINQISEDFNAKTIVATCSISLLLFGFGLGPLVWAPLSEVYGRKLAVLIPYFLAAIFSFATAVSKDIQTVIITRFFAGFFGSAPITNTGGVLGDIWTAEQRGVALVAYAMAVVVLTRILIFGFKANISSRLAVQP